MKYLLVLVACLLSLSGCQSINPQRQGAVSGSGGVASHPDVFLTKSVHWSVPSADIIKGDFSALQSVTGRYGDKTFELLVQVEKKGDSLIMVGVAPMGQQLLQMEYKGGVLTSKISPLLGEGIRPAYLISDFLMAYAEPDRLTALLEQQQLHLTYTDGSRTLLSNGQPVISISFHGQESPKDKWPKVVNYRHHALGYELEIKTVSREKI